MKRSINLLFASDFIIYEEIQLEDITGFLHDPYLNESFLTEQKNSGKDDYYGGGESDEYVKDSLGDFSWEVLLFFLCYTLYIIRYRKWDISSIFKSKCKN